MGNVWREEMGKCIYMGGGSATLWKTARKLSFAKVIFFPLVQPACTCILGFSVHCICQPGSYILGIPCGSVSCPDAWETLQTDSWQLHESQSAWLGHMGYNSPKTPLGNINAGECGCEFQLSWLTPKNASLPPCLPQFCSDSVTPSPSAVFVSKGSAWFCFLMHCWYRLPCSFFHGQ